jgi:alpha-L-arabinofuranosidase
MSAYQKGRDSMRYRAIGIVTLSVCMTVAALPAMGVEATIDAGKCGAPIHRYVYGQFTELLGNMFENGFWSEILSDRKFFYSINSSEKLEPVNTRRFVNRWRPVGPDEFIVMDTRDPYVGQHTPLVTLDGQTPHGIEQTGLAIRKGRSYTGRVVLEGDPKAKVEVRLIWGPGPADRQVVVIHLLAQGYAKYPLHFTCGADTDQGRLEIVGTGEGAFHVGAVSLMPADNLHGFRADIIPLLKELDAGIYRWPGGNFVSGYDWRDGIGDPDKRPPRYDYAWRTVELNDVGTDEFMTLCRLINIDPYICVNAGLGDAYSAAQWVEYCNGAADTAMGRLRRANGHPEPYGVKWWGIGNEMYGQWQLGHMSIDHFVLKHNQFAQAMRKVDPSIVLVASGATPFETSTTARHHRKPLPARLPYEYGSPEDWSGRLLAGSSDYFEVLAEHFYPVADSAFDAEKQEFVKVDDPVVDRVRRVVNRVRCTIEAWDEYQRRMPQLRDKKITIALDEWTGGRGGFFPTLCAAEGLHEIFRHSSLITMSGYTAASSCLCYNRTDATYSTIGLTFKLYRQHFGTLPVDVTGDSPQHEVKGTIGVDKPTVTSGSPTYPLDVAAAWTQDKKALIVAVVNPTESTQPIRLVFKGAIPAGQGRCWKMVAPNIDARNDVGQAAQVQVVESPLTNRPDALSIEPLSISLYEFRM